MIITRLVCVLFITGFTSRPRKIKQIVIRSLLDIMLQFILDYTVLWLKRRTLAVCGGILAYVMLVRYNDGESPEKPKEEKDLLQSGDTDEQWGHFVYIDN